MLIKQNRKFGLTLGAALFIMACWQFFLKHHTVYILFTIAIILTLLALAKPVWLNVPRLIWEKIGHVLGIINTHILLSLFYFLLLTPYALILRLTRKDILNLKKRTAKHTYWQEAQNVGMGTMSDQF